MVEGVLEVMEAVTGLVLEVVREEVMEVVMEAMDMDNN